MRAPSSIHGKVTRRARLPVLFGALAAVVAVAIVWLAQLNNDNIRWERHTLQVENALSDLTNAVNQAEAVQRGYLLTGQAGFMRVYNRVKGNVPTELSDLQAMTLDDANEQAAMPGVRMAVQRKFEEMDGAAALRKAGDLAGAQVSMNDGSTRALTRDILRAVDGMRQTEESLLAERAHRREFLNTALLVAVGASGVLVLVFAWLWVEQARRAGRELEIAYAELSAANEVLVAEMASRAAAEGQVRQMQKMEAIGQLTGGIAHDFNNMLAVVIGNLNLVQRRLAKGQTHVGPFVESAMEGAHRAAALTNRLLAFARQQPLAPEPIDPNRLVSGMSDMLTRTLGEPIVVETVLGAGLWRTQADAAQLENALVNLAVNARDAMPAGGRLTIETANSYLDSHYAEAEGAEAGQYVMIAVTDAGEGMSPEVIHKAVDPFFTTKPVGKGTGLGLSQVYGFVKQSGGHLKIYSEIGQGTTVKIYLPRLFAGEPAGPEARAATEPHAEANQAVVLVAEDDARVRQFAAEALRDLGYRVIETESAVQAMASLRAEPAVALLLTDIVMPEINGRELAQQAEALKPGLPVLYMTGFTRNAVVHNGILDPGVHLLPKPFTVDQLASKVRAALTPS